MELWAQNDEGMSVCTITAFVNELYLDNEADSDLMESHTYDISSELGSCFTVDLPVQTEPRFWDQLQYSLLFLHNIAWLHAVCFYATLLNWI